jgi:hypothetical protein
VTDSIVALQEYLRKVGIDPDAELLRNGIVPLTRLLMEMEVDQQVGAEWYERSFESETQRGSHRVRLWETVISTPKWPTESGRPISC